MTCSSFRFTEGGVEALPNAQDKCWLRLLCSLDVPQTHPASCLPPPHNTMPTKRNGTYQLVSCVCGRQIQIQHQIKNTHTHHPQIKTLWKCDMGIQKLSLGPVISMLASILRATVNDQPWSCATTYWSLMSPSLNRIATADTCWAREGYA